MAISAVINMIGVAVIVPFIMVCANPDTIFTHKRIAYFYHFFHYSNKNHFLIFLGIMVLALLLLSNGFSILTNSLSLRLVGGVQKSLTKRLLSSCIQQPYIYFLNKNSAKISTDLMTTVSYFLQNFLYSGLSLIAGLFSILLLVSMLFYVRPLTSSAIFFIFSFAFLGIYFSVRKKLDQINKRMLVNLRECNKISAEAFQGIKSHKIYNNESYYISAFSRRHAEAINDAMFSKILTVIPKNILEIVAFGLVVISIIYLISIDKNFSAIMPTLALFTFAGYRMLPLMQQIFTQFTAIKVTVSSVDSLLEYFDSFYSTPETLSLKHITVLPYRNSLKLNKVSFHYPMRDTLVLKDINITVPYNQTVGIIGPTGSGKTTLIDIILGLLTPSAGTLSVDGEEITEENKLGWQKNIGYVPQDIFLSDASIMDNIALGVPEKEIDRTSVYQASKLANIHEFIMAGLPNGYDTVVGERGVQLSGGQRQRIGIARALYHDPNVLVLDEATSALDQKTEKEVMEAIYGLKHQKTIIMVAHRLSTMAVADRVYCIEEGVLVDEGSLSSVLERQNMAFDAA